MPKITTPYAISLPDGREYNAGDIVEANDATTLWLMATLTYEQRGDVLDLFSQTPPLPSKQETASLPLLYILGNGSQWEDNEIRYSLRSAERYFPHSKVFVVGECPAWLNNAVHIPAADPYGNKLKNSIHKLHTAVQDERLPHHFVLMNDDFFFLKPLDTLAVYYKGLIEETLNAHPTNAGYYYEAMWLTRVLLEKAGIENPRDYSVHFPMIFDKVRVNWLCSSMRYQREGVLFRTVYANYFKLGGQRREDVKIKSVTDILKTKTLDVLSTDDEIVLTPEFQTWISKKFPKPSRYEADAT